MNDTKPRIKASPPAPSHDFENTMATPELAVATNPRGRPAVDELAVGATLSHFTISGELGRGGMGIVFRAFDNNLHRAVALKVLPSSFAADSEWRARFLREARAAAAVSHPNIAAIYEVGEDRGRIFIAMELIEGELLQQRLTTASLHEGLRLMAQIARAIARAHDSGVIHRDLKPDNVMISAEGEVKILDFGLAKRERDTDARAVPDAEGTSAADPFATRHGAIMGTPGYMSPEQVLGRSPDHRTDIYSLGVMLYRLAAKTPPFEGSITEIMAAVAHTDPPPPSTCNPKVSPQLEQVIMRCMARQPESRYASAKGLLADLETLPELLATGPTSFALPPSRPPATGMHGALASSRGPDANAATPARELPTGIVTLLCAEIVDGVALIESLGAERYGEVLARYDALLQAALDEHDGVIVDRSAEGTLAVFASAGRAAAAGAALQRRVGATARHGTALRVRVGMHTGEPRLSGGRYLGLDVHRAMRIGSSAQGGQVLLSVATVAHIEASMWTGAALLADLVARDLGTHRLLDLRYPEHLYELVGPGLAASEASLNGAAARQVSLPSNAKSFVGRRRELDELQAILRGEPRLVTLVGPGGAGKTRLAIEAARGLADEIPGGVVLVALAPVSEPAMVLHAIAESLGVPELAGRPIIDGLKARLGRGPFLLVLDNFEYVVEAAPGIGELLAACPELKILVTSQQPLRLASEREFAVSFLALPPDGVALAELSRYDAVQLFVERACQVSSRFALTHDNAPVVASICAKLDGLPLAIELAASRLKMLSLPALLERLSDRLGLLKGGTRDVERHQTLRAAIDWSHGLLGVFDKRLFRRAAVFSGGFSIEAAEAVCGLPPADGDDAAEAGDVFDGFASLADKNLLTRTEADGEMRLGMLATIREYATAELARSPDHAAVRAAHAAYYLDLVEGLQPDLLGRDQRSAVSRLLIESENLRAALAWALEQAAAETTSRFLEALLWFWVGHGKLAEGRTWAERAMEQTRTHGTTEARGRVLAVLGWLYAFGGDHEAAHAAGAASVAIFRALGRAGDAARTSILVGHTAAAGGDEHGADILREAVSACRANGDLYGVGIGLNSLGELARGAGKLDQAREHYEAAMAIMRQLSNVFWLSMVTYNLSHVHLHEGDWRAAAELLRGTLELSLEFNNDFMVAVYLSAMGGVAALRGSLDEAARLIGAADTQLTALGTQLEPADQAECDRHYARAAAVLGDAAAAAARREGAAWSRERAIAASRRLHP